MHLLFSTLRLFPIFSEFTPEEKNSLLRNGRLRNLKRGQTLFSQGDSITSFYLIFKGSMQIFRETPDGHELTSEILIPGEMICGDIITLVQKYHRTNARAIDNVAILEIPVRWILAHANAGFALKIISVIAARMHEAQVEAEHLSTMSAAQIVECFLQKIIVQYNFDPKGFNLPYSKTLIASRLHMELATFSRALKKLKNKGVLVKGAHISFTNIHKASHYACESCSISEDCSAYKYFNKKTHEVAHDSPIPNISHSN